MKKVIAFMGLFLVSSAVFAAGPASESDIKNRVCGEIQTSWYTHSSPVLCQEGELELEADVDDQMIFRYWGHVLPNFPEMVSCRGIVFGSDFEFVKIEECDILD